MTSTKYYDVSATKLLPSVNDFGLNGIAFHLDDSAKVHRTKKVKEWHESNNISKIERPGKSPDLNPIENLWAILKFKLNARPNRNKRELISNILRIWFKKIPLKTFKNLSNSMPIRIQKVLENKGSSTKY